MSTAILLCPKKQAVFASWIKANVAQQKCLDKLVIVVDRSFHKDSDNWVWADCYIHAPNASLGVSRFLGVQEAMKRNASYATFWDVASYYNPEFLTSRIERIASCDALKSGITPFIMGPMIRRKFHSFSGPHFSKNVLNG